MKMFPKIYNSATTEPFRVENYHDNKIEFYYLEDNVNYSKFVSKGRFSVWTSNGTDFRLFIAKDYYETMSDFYQNDVNTVWLDYIDGVYAKQGGLSKKYMLYSLAILVIGVGLMFLLDVLIPENSMSVFILMGILIVGLFVTSNMQQKKLKAYIHENNQVATDKVKAILGDAEFEKLIEKENQYRNDFFKIDDVEDIDTQDVPEEIAQSDENSETVSDDENGKE